MNATLIMIQTIERVRRAMPRNPDVMGICDALERTLTNPDPANPGKLKPKLKRAPKGTFDRKTFMRETMRKRRAEGKA